jgi:hypothetical protein
VFYILETLILGNPFPPREEIRNFSLPIPAPIGQHRRVSPVQRAFSADFKNTRDKEPWRPEPEWNGPWPATPKGNPRQMHGIGPLGVNVNEQPWSEVFARKALLI